MELILVLAIIVVSTGLAVPLIENMLSGNKLTAAADIVKSRLTDMRTRALEEGIAYKMTITQNGDIFRVEPAEPQEGMDVVAQQQDTELPKDVVIMGCNAINTECGEVVPCTEVVVMGNGTSGSPPQDFEIAVGSGPNDTRPIIVRFNGQTGAVTSGYAVEGGRQP